MAAPTMEASSEQFQTLYSSMSAFVDSCMSGHDPSHNPAHVHRVVNVALAILEAEQALHPTKKLDAAVVKLAALLHDIGDRKYLSNLSSATASDAESLDPKTMVEVALLKHGASADLASKVQSTDDRLTRLVYDGMQGSECNSASDRRRVSGAGGCSGCRPVGCNWGYWHRTDVYVPRGKGTEIRWG